MAPGGEVDQNVDLDLDLDLRSEFFKLVSNEGGGREKFDEVRTTDSVIIHCRYMYWEPQNWSELYKIRTALGPAIFLLP